MSEPERLFVYGSLQPGGANEHVLAAVPGAWARGTVRGRLEHVGWGSDLGYPAIVLDDGADPVPGWVLTSEELGARWAELDDFEGDEYRRVEALVRGEDGAAVRAWIYVLREPRP